MYKNIEFEQMIKNGLDNYVLIDLRSPIEYKEATIPGALNIPLFTDEERAEIGTVFNHVSVEEAKRLGIQYVSNKLLDIYNRISELSASRKKVVVFCARGGFRSSSLVALFSTLGIGTEKLKGGYKSYRHYINLELPKLNQSVKYVVLHGNTGVGKTRILEKLREMGLDVLDLEKCANNRGSLLGGVGLGESHAQKYFDSLVFDMLLNRKSDIIFVEAESKRIGNVNIHDQIFTAMKQGIHVKLTANLQFRAKLLVDEYTAKADCDFEIRNALDQLKKYIGDKNRLRFEEMLSEKRYIELSIELMQKYYDSMYENESKKYDYSLEMEVNDIDQCAMELYQWFVNRQDG